VQLENPAEALRNHDEKFKVTAPKGYIFRVTAAEAEKSAFARSANQNLRPFLVVQNGRLSELPEDGMSTLKRKIRRRNA